MKVITAKSSWIRETDLRIDASYHLSEGRLAKILIGKSKYPVKNVGELSSSIFYGGRSKRYYVESKEKGIPFMGSADMLKSDFFSLKHISNKYTKKLDDFKLQKNWILISRSGTVGNTAFTNGLFENKAASEHIIRIIPNEKALAGFLYSYLSTKFGYALLTQGMFGAVIQSIEPDFISEIPVPIFPKAKQQTIHDLIMESSQLRVEANQLLAEAINYFDKQYKVTSLTKVFSKSLKKIDFSFAAYNNNVECDNIENLFGKDYILFKDIAESMFAPPIFKHIYLTSNNGYPFLTGAELSNYNKKIYRWLSKRGVRDIHSYQVQKDTLLVYKSGSIDGDAFGSVFIVDSMLDGTCLSDHIIRVIIKDKNIAYWVFAFLKSESGILFLKKMQWDLQFHSLHQKD